MSQSETLNSLLVSITDSTKLLDQIKELFVVHKNAMSTRDVDQLEDNNSELADHLLLLRDQFATRIELQMKLCPELNEENWKAYLKTLPTDDQNKLESAWQELDSRLAEVQELSQVNQQIVRRGQRQIDDLVSILQGKGRTSKVYNERGASGHLNTQSTLGKA